MSSKTLNKRKKLRGVKNATKKTKKHMRKYLGGGKYSEDDNFFKAYREIYNDAPRAAAYWLQELQKTIPEDDDISDDISDLIQKLNKSYKLLEEAKKDIEYINDL